VRQHDLFVIRALADTYTWRVELADATRRTYEYRTIVHRLTGETVTGPWTRTDARLLPIPVV
jgi:hypothetical protein